MNAVETSGSKGKGYTDGRADLKAVAASNRWTLVWYLSMYSTISWNWIWKDIVELSLINYCSFLDVSDVESSDIVYENVW